MSGRRRPKSQASRRKSGDPIARVPLRPEVVPHVIHVEEDYLELRDAATAFIQRFRRGYAFVKLSILSEELREMLDGLESPERKRIREALETIKSRDRAEHRAWKAQARISSPAGKQVVE